MLIRTEEKSVVARCIKIEGKASFFALGQDDINGIYLSIGMYDNNLAFVVSDIATNILGVIIPFDDGLRVHKCGVEGMLKTSIVQFDLVSACKWLTRVDWER